MLKVVFLVTKKAGMSAAEFASNFERHVEIVNQVPGLLGMVGNVVEGGSDDRPAYDALGEVWFESADHFERARATDQWQRAVDDAARFMASHPHLVARELVLRVPPTFAVQR
jgi:uncharacterized protein (TIGR02118 family)